ncbi:MAG: SDR family NAD(P)-dependent oxidoreductase [Deltaproteobacteria bacterium]|nr:MAG: SDR family NAD(P)-dependent oxidoreductase [Deltaproteobacteria bacterium]
MSAVLVIISGASSGIGRALADGVPFPDARTVDMSRRGAAGCEHVAVDLAEPAGWRAASDWFAREVAGFSGERAVFLHSAGTLEPIGFAGEVDPDAYRRNVLLNSAAPQILGDAFLRAARQTRAACDLVMLSSGAARSVYPGWSSYGAGKAAVDQWVRTAGAEQARRGGRCRVLSVAPGVVETPMQAQIRATPPDSFPEVERFVGLHASGELRRPEDAARDVWALLLRGEFENGAVLDLREVAAGKP